MKLKGKLQVKKTLTRKKLLYYNSCKGFVPRKLYYSWRIKQ